MNAQDELRDLRARLESVAEGMGDDSWSWEWDVTRMHLTVSDANGDPVATLHVELLQ